MHRINYVNRRTGEIEVESPPSEDFLRFLYHNPFGNLSLSLLIKHKFLSAFYGYLMDSSRSCKKIQPFIKDYAIDMTESIKPVTEFTSFNDFFCRKLKPVRRNIQAGFVSPADGKVIAFEDIASLGKFFVKGRKFNLIEFLNNNKLAKKYKKSSLILIRLAPHDYHRFHFPYAGQPSEVTKIKGSYFSVSPYATLENFAKVFCENKREYTILKTEDKGDILISPVGATMVGRILVTFKANTDVEKGAEMGYFAFGGSSILLLIDQSKIKIDVDILKNTQNGLETSILMGEKMGV
ncbi:MAG: phosphatidylserine decarboxylase [bacterium]|nr:phosphatidylserine decarboxylase [bacterium]